MRIKTLANVLSNLVLATPQDSLGLTPQTVGEGDDLPPLLFHYEANNELILEMDVTDHFTEDNSAIHDQAAIRPEVIHTNGFIGELNDVTPPILMPQRIISEKLSVLNGFVPQMSEVHIRLYNEAFSAYQTARNVENAAVSAWATISGNEADRSNKQQLMFRKLYLYMQERRLFTVQTPWSVFRDMIIIRLTPTQTDDRMITDFNISFKAMRFAHTVVRTGLLNMNFQNRLKNQGALPVDTGREIPTPANFGLEELLA